MEIKIEGHSPPVLLVRFVGLSCENILVKIFGILISDSILKKCWIGAAEYSWF